MTNIFMFFIFLLSETYCQLTPLSVELAGVSHVTAGGGKVFVSDQDSVYRYSSTTAGGGLQQEQSQSIGQDIIGIAVTPDGEGLVICLDNEECVVRNGSDLAIVIDTQTNVVSEGSTDPIALFTTSVPDGQSFYVGSYGTVDIVDDSGDRPRFGQYGFLGSSLSRRSDAAVPGSANLDNRLYFNGFTYSDYAYFIVVDRIANSIAREVRIIRVCNDTSDGSIQSQIELQLQCGSGSGLTGSTLIRGVSVFNEDMMTIDVYNTGSNPVNRLCLYNISEINTRMDEVYQTCVVSGNGDRNVLWDASGTSCSTGFNPNPTICNFAAIGPLLPSGIAPSNALLSSVILSNNTVLNGLRASIGLTLDNIDLIFVGYTTSNDEYYLNKYHWINNSVLSLIEEVLIAPSISVNNDDGLSIVASVDQQTLYLTTDDKIVSVSVENCSSASSCEECVSLGDPLCGWCVFEDKCSHSSQCMNSESTGRYLTQGQQNSCLQTVDIVPATFVKDLESEPFEVSVTFVPSLTNSKLPNEQFYCSFNNSMMSVVSVVDNGVCSVVDILNKLTGISLETEFSILSNVTGVHFFISKTPYLFYDCVPQQTCSGCVEGSGVCGWCQLDFTCSGDNTTCTGGHNNWITTTSSESTPSDVCPLLVANDGSMIDYTQPLNVPNNLSLKTLNTPTLPNLSYECVFGSEVRPATRSSDTSVECVIGTGEELTSSLNTETVEFTLRQIYDGTPYDLQTNGSVDINVVLYNCPSLASSCSRCLGQNINTGFNCGWCNDNTQCIVNSQCAGGSGFVTMASGCGPPMITNISPSSGSPRGQTTITIDGINLGVVFNDIVSVSVGKRSCNSIEDQYRSGVRIVCTISTSGINGIGTATITVTINNGVDQLVATSDGFMIVQPTIESVIPDIGPVSGGSTVTMRGTNMDIGNKNMTRVLFRDTSSNGRRRKRQSCPEIECDINYSSLNSTYLSCISGKGSSNCVMSVVVVFDGDEVNNNDVVFQYTPDPIFESVTPHDVIPVGGFYVTFMGMNLNVTQSPVIRITDNRFQSSKGVCMSPSGNQLQCLFPRLLPLPDDSVYGSSLEYSVIVDNASGPDYTVTDLQLTLRPNPVINRVITNEFSLPLDNNDVIRIEGIRLTSEMRSYIFITVGDHDCPVSTVDATEVSCTVPTNIAQDTELYVNVTIGYLSFGNITDPWKVSFVTMTSEPPGVSSAVIGGAVGGVAFVAIIVIMLVVCVICVAARRASRKKDMRFIKLMSDMEKMEIEMAVTCKTAFAELQTDLGELVNEEALDSQLLPFQTFPTYATKFFFPNANVNHPVLCPPRMPEKLSDEDFKGLMTEFYNLILDKGFLCSFIKTLESQPKVTVHEKSTIASLLMVSCLKDIDYATEILTILLGDLIRTNLSQSRNHPKILLRRTESVAEKLLTNWFCVTLYPHLRETVGPPLFVLFKAVKAQLEKGPIDVITGEAKNSLSEEKLLRQSLDFKVVECEVDMANGHFLLSRMRNRLHHFQPDNAAMESDIQTVKLLDSDSISQTKEKLLDFLFRNRPVSQRPGINEVELELCRGSAGISLKDQDTISKKDGEWTRINTLGHYDIPTMAEAAIEDPKKPTPRFRLKYRGDRPRSGANYDVAGTIIASASVTSQTSLLNSPILQSMESNTNRLYHLVKPDMGDGESSKIVSEVFLTRLLSTKRILQPYVDDLFHAIFTIPRGKPFPLAIKVFFDFLDLQAAELNIMDPEVLHIWKTNGLPLRFWVNLIKNPEFIFDINKSATIDACFTVIAQAYIDACSTSEVRYTKDTPSARLLYAKEVSSYKSEVLSFYEGVQSIPQVSQDDLKQHFRESLNPLFKEFENHDGCHFHSDSALLELYRYAVQYGDQICETLQEDRLAMLAAQFNSLKQKYPIDSSAM